MFAACSQKSGVAACKRLTVNTNVFTTSSMQLADIPQISYSELVQKILKYGLYKHVE